ncbi:hypothetical protein NE235_36820, partial [Actinoallomurus spadix]|nr:hypothetical protein [Actinoallomurus spadix]
MSDAPWGGVAFNDDERRLFLVLMGEEPPEAVPGEVYGLSQPFYDFATNLANLPGQLSDTLTKIDGALPDEVVAQYKEVIRDLTGGGTGANHINEIIDAATSAGDQVAAWSRELMKAQLQMIMTLIMLELQLAIMTAMAFFTGGASLGEEAVAYAAARLEISMTLQWLAALLIDTSVSMALQAAIGGLMMMTASLLGNALDGDPDTFGVDWKMVGAGALGGALSDLGWRGAGLGLKGLGSAFDHLAGDGLKKVFATDIAQEIKNIGGDFVQGAASAALSSTLTSGAVYGEWEFSPGMVIGGGVGGVVFGAQARMMRAAGPKVFNYRTMSIDPVRLRGSGFKPSDDAPGGGEDPGTGGGVGENASPAASDSSRTPPPSPLPRPSAGRPEPVATVGREDPLIRPGGEVPLPRGESGDPGTFGGVTSPAAQGRNVPPPAGRPLPESTGLSGENGERLPRPASAPSGEHVPPAVTPRVTFEPHPEPVSPLERSTPGSESESPVESPAFRPDAAPGEPLSPRNLATPEAGLAASPRPDAPAPAPGGGRVEPGAAGRVPPRSSGAETPVRPSEPARSTPGAEETVTPPPRPRTTSTTPAETSPRPEPGTRATGPAASARNAGQGGSRPMPETERPGETTTRTGGSPASAGPRAEAPSEPLTGSTTVPPAESSAVPVRTESGRTPASGEPVAEPRPGSGPGAATGSGSRPGAQTPPTPARTETGSAPRPATAEEGRQNPSPPAGRERPATETPDPASRKDRRAYVRDASEEETSTPVREANASAGERPATPVSTESVPAYSERSDESPQDPPPYAEHGETTTEAAAPGGHRPDESLVDPMALDDGNVTPNYRLNAGEPITQGRRDLDRARLLEETESRLTEEDGRQQTADQRVDAAIAAYHDGPNIFGVPDLGTNADPAIRLREAGFPDRLHGPIIEAYRAALAEDDRERAKPSLPRLTSDGEQALIDKPPTLQERLTAKLEPVLGVHEHPASSSEVAALLLRRAPGSEPEGWARKAGVPEDLVSTVAEAYRTARAQEKHASADEARPFEQRLTDALETRLYGLDHDLFVPAVADRMIREQARLDADRTRPWTFDVRDRFDSRWKPEFERHLRGELTRDRFERSFQQLVDGLHGELEVEAAVRSVRARAEAAFDAVVDRERFSPAEEARALTRFLDVNEAEVRRIAEEVGLRGEAPRANALYELQDRAGARTAELVRGLRTRLQLEDEAKLHFRRLTEETGLDPASDRARTLRADYDASFEAFTRTLPDGRETRTLPVGEFERHATELGPALRELDERFIARISAQKAEDGLLTRLGDELVHEELYWRGVSDRPRAEVDGVDYDAVLEEARTDLRDESTRLLGGRSVAELTARDWDDHTRALTAASGRLIAELQGRLDEHAGRAAMLRRIDRALEGTGRPDSHVERVRADFRTAMTDAHKEVVGHPGEGLWSREELVGREERFYHDHFLPYLHSLADRLRLEARLDDALAEGAGRFNELTTEASELTERAQRRFALPETRFQEIANDFRNKWARIELEHYGPSDRDPAKWLELERAQKDVFGVRLRERWEALEAETDASRLARRRERAAVGNARNRERLAAAYVDMVRRADALESLERVFEQERPTLRSPRAFVDYQAGQDSLRARLGGKMSRASSEEVRTAILAEARKGLAALREQVKAREQAYRDWREKPEWTLDLRRLELTRTPLVEYERRAGLVPEPEAVPAAPEPPVEQRAFQAYVEDAPEEGATPAEVIEQAQVLIEGLPLEVRETPPEVRETPLEVRETPPELRETPPVPSPARLAAEARATEELARLRTEIEQRDKAHRAFDAVLAEQSNRGSTMTGAGDRIISAREWFVQQWVTTDPESRSGLETEVIRRLVEARAVADARRVFTWEVVSYTRPAVRALDPEFHYGPQVTALRDEFVQAMTEGPVPTEDARARLVAEFRGRYDDAARAWRQQPTTEPASQTTSATQDGQQTAHPDGEAPRGDAVPETPASTMITDRAPDLKWTPEVTSWYRREQAEIARRITDFVEGRTLDPSTQARLAADHARQLDALHDIAERRDVAQREFTRFLSAWNGGQVTLRSGAMADWVRRHVADLRRRFDDVGTPYVDTYLAAAAAHDAEEHGWTPVSAPSYAEPGDWRTPAWHAAQARLYETLEAAFTKHDAEIAQAASPADRRAFEEIYESWAPKGAGKTLRDHLVTIRERVQESFERRILAGDQERQEILDGLADELDREAARQVALQAGQEAYERAFQDWSRRLDAAGSDAIVLTEDMAKSVLEGERPGFQEKWETAVEELLDAVTGITGIRAVLAQALPEMRRAVESRLRELTGDDLLKSFDRRADYALEQERFARLVFSATESFRENLSAPDRDLLAALASENAVPSEPGRTQVVFDGWRELDTAYEEIFPPGAEVTAEMRQRWQARFDTVAASVPSALAHQTAREGALTSTLADVNTAIEAWRTAPPETLGEFRKRFDVAFGGALPDGVRRSVEESVARSVNTRFGELFTGEQSGTPAERLEQWRTWYGETIGRPRLHALFARETAKQIVAAQAAEITASATARWRQDHPETVLSDDDAGRVRTGLTERMTTAFDEIFGGALDKPEDLAERTVSWDRQVERLTSELPAHFAFEATVPAALKTAGRSFQTKGAGHDLDDSEWVNRTAEVFREDFFDEYRLWWAPMDRATVSAEDETTADLFKAGRAEAVAQTRPAISTETAIGAETPVRTDVAETTSAETLAPRDWPDWTSSSDDVSEISDDESVISTESTESTVSTEVAKTTPTAEVRPSQEGASPAERDGLSVAGEVREATEVGPEDSLSSVPGEVALDDFGRWLLHNGYQAEVRRHGWSGRPLGVEWPGRQWGRKGEWPSGPLDQEGVVQKYSELYSSLKRTPLETAGDLIARLHIFGRMDPQGKGSGKEKEYWNVISLPRLEAEAASRGIDLRQLDNKLVLANGPHGAQLVLETKKVYLGPGGRYYTKENRARVAGGTGEQRYVAIVELVYGVVAELPGESYADRDLTYEVEARTEDSLSNIPGTRGSGPSIPLLEVLGPGWSLTKHAEGALIGPPPVGAPSAARDHYNEGVPPAVGHEYLKRVRASTWRDQRTGYFAGDHLDDALAFADQIAARFLSQELLGYIVEDPQVMYRFLDVSDLALQELRFHAAALYVHAATYLTEFVHYAITKAHAAALVRHDPATLYAALPERARGFLAEDRDAFVEIFEQTFLRRIPDYDDRYLKLEGEPRPDVDLLSPMRNGDISPRRFLDAGLVGDRSVMLGKFITGVTVLRKLDTNGGLGKAVVEARYYGQEAAALVQRATASQSRQNQQDLGDEVRRLYSRAERLNHPSDDDRLAINAEIEAARAEARRLAPPRGEGLPEPPVRFGAIYRNPRWPDVSQDYEREVAKRLSQTGLDVARKAVIELYNAFTGEARTDVASWFGTENLPVRSIEELAYWVSVNSTWGLDETMTALSAAARRGAETGLSGLSARGAGPYSGWWRERMRARGYRPAAAPPDGVELVFSTYRDVMPRSDDGRGILAAMIAWRVPAGDSLFDIVLAWQRAGYDDEWVRSALHSDGAALGEWVSHTFAWMPLPPHLLMYDGMVRWDVTPDVAEAAGREGLTPREAAALQAIERLPADGTDELADLQWEVARRAVDRLPRAAADEGEGFWAARWRPGTEPPSVTGADAEVAVPPVWQVWGSAEDALDWVEWGEGPGRVELIPVPDQVKVRASGELGERIGQGELYYVLDGGTFDVAEVHPRPDLDPDGLVVELKLQSPFDDGDSAMDVGGSRVGLRGGAPGGDSGLVGSEVVISGPRVAGVWSVSVRDVPAVAAGAGGKEAERWFDHARRDGSGSQASGYRVSSDGSLAFSDGVVLSPDGWVRIGVAGADFVHMPEGVVLRADTGEIVRVGNRDQLGRMLADKLFGAVPYTLVRGPAGLYLVPAGAKDGLAVYVPLSADLGAFVASAWSVTPGGLVRAGRWGVDFGGLRFWLQSVVGAAGGDGFGEALVASLGAAGVVGAPRTVGELYARV